MDSAWARQEMQGARVFDRRRITSLTTKPVDQGPRRRSGAYGQCRSDADEWIP